MELTRPSVNALLGCVLREDLVVRDVFVGMESCGTVRNLTSVGVRSVQLNLAIQVTPW